MTTIAWDGKSLAADKQVGDGWTLSKIWKLKDGSLFSGCGYYDHLAEVADWLNHGGKTEKKPWLPNEQESSFIWIDAKGTCHWLTYPYLRPIKFSEKIVAVGSGGAYALGAMRAGADAKRAIEIASEYDPATGKGVTVMKPGIPTKTGKTKK